MPRSFLIKQKGFKKYCRDQYCYPDCVPYCFSDGDSPNTPPSPPHDYEKLYPRGHDRYVPNSADELHQLPTERETIMQAHYMFDGGDPSLPPSVTPSNSSSPPTPSMFHDNHWITQSTLFPFVFKEFERKARDTGEVDDKKDVSKLQCTKCKKQFETSTSLEEHVKTAHAGNSSNARSYTCQYCGRSFSRSWNFQRHVLIHKGEKPHKCDKCPKAFVLAAHLKIHNRIHTGEKPYKCDICSRGFAQLTNLQRHVLTHTGQKPHKCTYCPKAFVSSSDLRRHVRTHTGEKPYQCEKCPKAFTTSGNLHSHMLTHTGEKPYACKICKWKFISSSNLRTHCRIHHKRT